MAYSFPYWCLARLNDDGYENRRVLHASNPFWDWGRLQSWFIPLKFQNGLTSVKKRKHIFEKHRIYFLVSDVQLRTTTYLWLLWCFRNVSFILICVPRNRHAVIRVSMCDPYTSVQMQLIHVSRDTAISSPLSKSNNILVKFQIHCGSQLCWCHHSK